MSSESEGYDGGAGYEDSRSVQTVIKPSSLSLRPQTHFITTQSITPELVFITTFNTPNSWQYPRGTDTSELSPPKSITTAYRYNLTQLRCSV